nr:hypothetical protein [Vibrio anguillarum]
MTKLYAQECEKTPNRFSLVGIDQLKGIAYAVRHGRTNELRTWRLDILINRVRKMGLSNVEVQLLHPADDA